jgi:predicted nucleotidyltransferase component of viral defense system
MLDVGPVLHPDDLVADKVLALWGRARPRDFYDVHALMRHYTRDALLHLATAKDTGFTIETFLDTLNAIKRLTDADWAEDGISVDAVPQLTSLFAEWRAALAAGG